MAYQSQPLSEQELDELDQFLMSDAISDEAMTLDILDGYLTAVVVGPITLVPSQWIPPIWGPQVEGAPDFSSMEKAQRIMDLIMRHYNSIVHSLQDYPDDFEPMYMVLEGESGESQIVEASGWTHGFLQGIALNPDDWQLLLDDPCEAKCLEPIRLLGAETISPEDEALIQTPEQRQALSERIGEMVVRIYRFWLPTRHAHYKAMKALQTVRRTTPKVGRNDPCPCGSGKKFKKCCGAASGD